MIQGSDEWRQARCGKITASKIADLMAKTKSGYSASRKNYLSELLVERLTVVPSDSYISTAMQWGMDYEAEARTLYEFETDTVVTEVGFIEHPNFPFSGASPDGLVGDDGMVEIKCPNTATHIDTLLTETIDSKYIMQMQWQMECCGRLWCDYMSYDPRMRDRRLVLFIKRVPKDQEFIDKVIAEVLEAEKELNKMLGDITARFKL